MLCSSHIKIWNLQITWKKWSKEHQTLSFQFLTSRSNILAFFALFFHMVCKISNFNMWTARHLAQLLVLSWLYLIGDSILITSPWSIFPWITLRKSYMEVVSFTFEFSWGVNLISHDSGDSFFNILHPLNHLGLAHKVDILNKRVIFLPERHVEVLCLNWTS